MNTTSVLPKPPAQDRESDASFFANLEARILAALLCKRDTISEVGEYLTPHHFQLPLHRAIAEVIWAMFKDGCPIDMLLVEDQLLRTGFRLPDGYISAICNMPSVMIGHDAHLLIEKSIKTDLALLCSEVINKAYESGADAGAIMDFYENGISEIGAKNIATSSAFVGSILPGAIEQLQNGGNFTRTLHPNVDAVLGGGVTPDDYIVIAARPSTGKTAFALSVARNFACKSQMPVALFSLEMSKGQLTNRMLAAETGIPLHRFTSGQISDVEWVKLVSINDLGKAQLYIDDTPGITMQQLRTRLRRMKAELGIKVAMIDYLQLIHPGEHYSSKTRQEAVSYISRRLKLIQKELGITLIALSQLSRAVESRSGDKRPQLSDLRESGSIEQDADMVWFLYRPELYGFEYDEDNLPTRGRLEVIVAKNRNGNVGTAKLFFNPENMRFTHAPAD